MSKSVEIQEIVRTLQRLPYERFAAARDFISFLNERYGNRAEDSEVVWEWSEADMRDFAAHSAAYAEEVAPWEESASGGRLPRNIVVPDETSEQREGEK